MKIAIVVHRYGLDFSGGSEYLARMIAEKLSKHFQVEVLTTCAKDYISWKNEYSEGLQTINNIPVRRFKTTKERMMDLFNKVHDKIINNEHNISNEIDWMQMQGPYSLELVEYIKKNKNNYDKFIFLPYLYFTTYSCLPLVQNKSILIPTAEDAPILRLSIFKNLFMNVSKIIYCTEAEKALVEKIFNVNKKENIVLGMGIDEYLGEIDLNNFKDKYKIDSEYILYIGRICIDKGCDELFSYFQKYIKKTKKKLKLVLIGNLLMEISKSENVIYCGFVNQKEKYSAISGAEFVIIPSYYESFSIILLESLLMKKPVIVQEKCTVTKEHCKKSNAGLWYCNYEEFETDIDFLLDNKNILKQMGEQGREYVKSNYSWAVIEKKYLSFIKNEK